MVKQIKNLTRLLLCNFWGINEFRFAKEKSKKARFVSIAAGIGMLAMLYMAYVAAATFSYIEIGLFDILPAYMLTLTSALILFLRFIKQEILYFKWIRTRH